MDIEFMEASCKGQLIFELAEHMSANDLRIHQMLMKYEPNLPVSMRSQEITFQLEVGSRFRITKIERRLPYPKLLISRLLRYISRKYQL